MAGTTRSLIFKTVDLSGPPGLAVKVIDPGIPVSDVYLNSPMPAGLNFRLIYGNNQDGLVFGPGGLLCDNNICPREWLGIKAIWSVASPGTLIQLVFAAGSGSSQAVAA